MDFPLPLPEPCRVFWEAEVGGAEPHPKADPSCAKHRVATAAIGKPRRFADLRAEECRRILDPTATSHEDFRDVEISRYAVREPDELLVAMVVEKATYFPGTYRIIKMVDAGLLGQRDGFDSGDIQIEDDRL